MFTFRNSAISETRRLSDASVFSQSGFVPRRTRFVLVPAKVQDITLGQDKFFSYPIFSEDRIFITVEDGLLIFPGLD